MKGIRIGELLVEQGVLSAEQVEFVLNVQKDCRQPFGVLAMQIFGVTAQAVNDAWLAQFIRRGAPTDLAEWDIDRDCLKLLSRDQAMEWQMLPVCQQGDSLNIATTASRFLETANHLARTLPKPVYLMVADDAQLADYLDRCYPLPRRRVLQFV